MDRSPKAKSLTYVYFAMRSTAQSLYIFSNTNKIPFFKENKNKYFPSGGNLQNVLG